MDEGAFLARVPLFASLPRPELSRLAAITRPRIFKKDEIIFHKGDPGQVMYFIKDGEVRIYMNTEDEQQVSVAILSAGDFFGELALFDAKPRSSSAVAMERTETLTMHRDDFLSQIQAHPRIAIEILAVLSGRLRQADELIENLTFLDVYGRVAKKLLDLAQEYGSETERGREIRLSLTQHDLASLVGATRESVNRVLSLYRERGLISVDRSGITVVKPNELRRRIY